MDKAEGKILCKVRFGGPVGLRFFIFIFIYLFIYL